MSIKRRKIVRVNFSHATQSARLEAIKLAEKGIPVFPCRQNKRPYTRNGFENATTDVGQINQWWSDWPLAFIGVPTGKCSNLFVIDIDPQGQDWYASNHDRLAITRTHKTNRGQHLLYLNSDESSRNSVSKIALGVDVRAEGGYIIWWPAHGFEAQGVLTSLHPPPRWILDANNVVSPNSRACAPDSDNSKIRQTIPLGQRNDYLSKEAFRLRKKGLSTAQIKPVLATLNETVCDPPLPNNEVKRIASAKQRIAPDTDANDSEAELELLRASSVEVRALDWVWKDWLALRKLHMLAGAPGTGKTTIALSFIATITQGGRWPDGTRCDRPRNALIWSGEDDPADTIVPRLIAAGADISRVYFIAAVTEGGEKRPFDPAKDMALLMERAKQLDDVGIVLIDPVVSVVGGDSHKNGEVRRGLMPLVNLAMTLGAVVLGISHFSKGTQGREPLDRLTGSLAFGAAPRFVMAATKARRAEGDTEDKRYFMRLKANNGPDEGGFQYSLKTVHLKKGIETSRVDWGDAIDGAAINILAEAESEGSDREVRNAVKEAIEFLIELLSNGPLEAESVKVSARDAGISWATIRRAKREIGIKPSKSGMEGGWIWSLPPKMLKPSEDAQ